MLVAAAGSARTIGQQRTRSAHRVVRVGAHFESGRAPVRADVERRLIDLDDEVAHDVEIVVDLDTVVMRKRCRRIGRRARLHAVEIDPIEHPVRIETRLCIRDVERRQVVHGRRALSRRALELVIEIRVGSWIRDQARCGGRTIRARSTDHDAGVVTRHVIGTHARVDRSRRQSRFELRRDRFELLATARAQHREQCNKTQSGPTHRT